MFLSGRLVATVRTVVGNHHRWRCEHCLKWSAKWNNLAAGECTGKIVEQWAGLGGVQSLTPTSSAGIQNENGHQSEATGDTSLINPKPVSLMRNHILCTNEQIVWCRVCGCYADAKAKGITNACNGPPIRRGLRDHGGMWGQLRKLRAGIHPKLGTMMINSGVVDVEAQARSSSYCKLEEAIANRKDVTPLCDSGFVRYTPAPPRVLLPNTGRPASELHRERLERVRRLKGISNTSAVPKRRIRGKTSVLSMSSEFFKSSLAPISR